MDDLITGFLSAVVIDFLYKHLGWAGCLILTGAVALLIFALYLWVR